MRKRQEILEKFGDTSELGGFSEFFLVGIGGAGMSALARMLKHRGFKVAGTDSTPSETIDRMREEGIQITIGHSGEGISGSMGVILTDAIDLEVSPEVLRARELDLPLFRRSQALGWMLRGKRVIAITGTHGKTTTTGMLGAGLSAAGLDPLVVVGANIPSWGGPVREGDGEWAVVEACEAYDAFHDLEPEIVVLTNLEADHLDYHGTYEHLRDSVVRFVDSIPTNGFLVYCSEDRGAAEVAELTAAPAFSYGLSVEWGRQIANKLGLTLNPAELDFTGLGDRKPTLTGRHNAMNACGAMMAGGLAGANMFQMMNGVISFTGAERRLEKIFEGNHPEVGSLVVLDDYAHHPSEVHATIQAIRERYFTERDHKRLVLVFQPHLYSRTEKLLNEFAKELSAADLLVITDIYPAREAPIPGVSSARIAEKVSCEVRYVPSRHLLPKIVSRLVKSGDVVVGMGAGNISEFPTKLVNELNRGIVHPKQVREARQQLRIAVLYAGDSSEREVSILSGRAIHQALTRLGHASRLVDVSERLLSKGDLSLFVGPDRPDLAFLAVHGTNAEDGAIQGLLELLHIPYTGSGIQSSSLCMDKSLTKKLLSEQGIRVPLGVVLTSPETEVLLPLPLVVKPNAEGSTVGVSFIRKEGELNQAIQQAFAYGPQVIVEELIEGIEISTPVLDGEPLLPVEIAPISGQYDFESKYTPGATDEIVPARLGQHLLAKAQQIALRSHEIMGCQGATRTDMIVRGDDIFVLEVNTLPGMTGTSLLPNSAQASGISFDELCQRLVVDAIDRYART